MSTKPLPADLYASLSLLRGHLPTLVGTEAWDALSAPLLRAVEQLAPGSDPHAASSADDEVRKMLSPYPEARDAVRACVSEMNTFRGRLSQNIRELLGNDTAADLYASSVIHGLVGVAPADGVEQDRSVTISPQGLGGARTVKLWNFWVKPEKMVEFLTHSALSAVHGVLHPHPVLIGVGVVLLAHCAREGTTIHIPEQDATVFWGLIQAQKQTGYAAAAPEPDVVACTNRERGNAGLGTLPPASVAHSLDYLENLRCVGKIARAPTHWRVMEAYKII